MALKTQVEFARQIGKTPQYVNKLVKQGKIVLVKGKVDTKQALGILEAYKRHGKVIHPKQGKKKTARPAKTLAGGGSKRRIAAPPKPSGRKPMEGTITAHRTVKEEFEAKTARLKFLQLEEKLLPREDVLKAQQRQNQSVRENFRGIARMLAVQLSQATSPSEVETILLQEVDAVLAKLADDPLGLGEQKAADVEAVAPAVTQTFAQAAEASA